MNFHTPHPAHPVALESPASIAILGGGPIGLEAALYGKFLGYDVTLFEQGPIAANVRRWGHLPMLTPFQYLHSRMGRSAILTQQSPVNWPADESTITGRQWLDDYLLPLAASDLVAPTLRPQHRVTSVSRCRFRKQHPATGPLRWEDGFEVQWLDPQGAEQRDSFDFVIDATGTYQHSQPWGLGGGPALGEARLRAQWSTDPRLQQSLHFVAPDRAATPQPDAPRRTLIVGDRLAAVHAALELGKAPGPGRVVWALPQRGGEGGPFAEWPSDPLPLRDRWMKAANRWVLKHQVAHLSELSGDSAGAGLQVVTETQLSEIRWEATREVFQVTLRQWQPIDWDAAPDDFEEPDDCECSLEFDQVIVAVGHRPDPNLAGELIAPLCPATECQASLIEPLATAGDRFRLQLTDPQWTWTPEGRYFVVGTKSFGRQGNFFYRIGLQQVRNVYRWIVGRANLDLETTLQNPDC